MKTSLLCGALHSLYNQFGNSIYNIFSFLIIHSHDRTSSITRVHATTWDYFTENLEKSLEDRFLDSPKVVKEEIMKDINDLVQGSEFATSINLNGAVFAMRSSRLLGILQSCFNSLENELDHMVCFNIISFFLDCQCCRLS